ncbi:MAG: ATPase [Lachnospiraceae bacterium]|nr:ATPase [Lachnospiraceae bacterium]
MASRIEQLIEEIESYIDTCKPQAFSKDNIIVDRNHIEELLDELKKKTPEDIKRYQRIVAQKDAILEDARASAQALVDKATIQTNELVSEHEIMQQAHARAQEVELMARQKAQELIDAAAIEANNMRMAAVQYTDDLLANIENLLSHSIQTTQSQYENLNTSLNQYLNVVTANREELRPAEEHHEDSEQAPAPGSSTGEIPLDLL